MKTSTTIKTFLVSGIVAVTGSNAEAFMTGPHFEATERGLVATGFNWGAIDLAKAANYQTDYITNKRGWMSRLQQVLTLGLSSANDSELHAAANYFHFTALPDAASMARELAWLEEASRRMAVEAVRENNPEKLLNALGIALHAVQDIYAHSTMADRAWEEWLGQPIVLFENIPEDFYATSVPRLNVRSSHGTRYGLQGPAPSDWPSHDGAEGDWWRSCAFSEDPVECGMNHDSQTRGGFGRALEMAVLATQRWAEKFRGWVANDGFWQRVQQFPSRGWVRHCLARAQETSSAAGQWGSPGGISYARFAEWALLGARCSWDWQDWRWGDTLMAMIAAQGGERGAHHRNLAPRTDATRNDHLGCYEITVDAARGVMSLRAGSGPSAVVGSLTIAGLSQPLVGETNGAEIAIVVAGGARSVKGHLMTRGWPDIAGYVRNRDAAAPTGFLATRNDDACGGAVYSVGWEFERSVGGEPSEAVSGIAKGGRK